MKPADLATIRAFYALPFPDLMFRAQQVHRKYHDPTAVQLCTLQSIKTGRCPEDCKYCPQSAHYDTGVEAAALLDSSAIIRAARVAWAGGATRFCLGAAWRDVPDGASFDSVLASVQGVAALGLEVCCTLGMLNESQAIRLKAAGCTVYNHNLDTSRDYYPKIISTRTYDDRLATLKHVRAAGLEVCCGGIIGLGESVEDRLKLLAELAALEPPPESVPINALVPVPGTPLEDLPPVDPIEFVRTIATARIVLPRAMVRLSAGRLAMSHEMQALCFLAGANSIFLGERLLTTPNPERSADQELFGKLGLHRLAPREPESRDGAWATT